MSAFYVPQGAALISAILCITIIAISVFTLLKLKPRIRYVLGGTIGCAVVVLWHLITTPPMYEVAFGQATELMALLICISSLLAGYVIEIAQVGKEQ